MRQRLRLLDVLGGLGDEEWAAPSRCEGWSARDVIVHLDTTNTFWAFSAVQGLAGEPTRILATFDPVASPAQMVSDAAAKPAGEVLEAFAASTVALTDLLSGLDGAAWDAVAESPPGHVSISTMAHHALWDSWVHERDVLLPLGLEPTVEDDEVTACLRYAAALGPALGRTNGAADRGVLAVATTAPHVEAVVTIDGGVRVETGREPDADLTLGGDAVDLLEALSIRRPLDQAVPPESAWMVDGLATVFDT